MKIKAILTAAFMVSSLYGGSQTNKAMITGKVTDSITKVPIPFASILLRYNVDTTIKRITATAEDGSFIISDVPAGEYLLQVSYLGYKTSFINIVLNGKTSVAVSLVRNDLILRSVDVQAKKQLIIQTADKLVLNVKDGAITASDNLYNIILKIPGVLESNGALFYQGRPVNLALDGKSNNLNGEELRSYLSAMLGTNADKVEVLLNPSSRYDAHGGVVINIVPVKNKSYGFTNTITAGIGSGRYLRYPLGFAFNFRDSSINVYGGYDYNHTKQFINLKAHLTFNASNAMVQFNEDDIRVRDNHALRLGLDYDISKKTSIGFLFRGSLNLRDKEVDNVSHYTPGNSLPDTIASVQTLAYVKVKNPSLNLWFKLTGKKGAELVLNADYFNYVKTAYDDFTIRLTDKAGASIAPTGYMHDDAPANNIIRSLTADHYIPFKKGKIETGVKITESKTDNEVLWQYLQGNEWKTDPGKTNHFIYKENIYAGYINMNRQLGKWSLQTGLRYEATRSNGTSVTLNKATNKSHDGLYLSTSVQFKPTKTLQFAGGYRRSIKRFGFDIVNPFIIYLGQYAYHQGNPNIKPSFYNTIDVSCSYKNKLIITVGYSQVKDPMSYAYSKIDNSDASIGTYLNFKKGSLYNAGINYTGRFLNGKWTSVNAFTFLHSVLPTFTSEANHSNNYAFSTTNNIVLPFKATVELAFFYNSKLLDGTVAQTAYYGTSVGISKSLFRSKGSVKLGCTDVFDSQILHFNTQGNGVIIASHWKRESRFISLLFTYRLGNLNVKGNKGRSTGIEEEKSRMGGN